MKTIANLDLCNIVGGQSNQPLWQRQAQSTLNYNACVGAATNKANDATNAAGLKMATGEFTPSQGIAGGVEANRTLRSDTAACNTANPIPSE